MDLLNRIRRYRNAYKNYISVMWGIYTKKEPLKCILKDDSVHMWSIHKAWQYTFFVSKINESNVIDYFDGKAEYLKLQYKDKGVVFYGADEMGGAIQGSFANCNISVDLDLFNGGIIEYI